MNAIKTTLLCGAVALTLSACASGFASGFYTPQLTGALGGKVKIDTFTSNQPELTQKSQKAKLGYDLNTWLSEFYTDAVSQEFIQMNAYDDNAKCTLSGEITNYDWGSVGTELDVTFNLSKGGKILMVKNTSGKRTLDSNMQLQVAQTMLHRIMTDSVNQLVTDASFLAQMKKCN
jgi:hypothetical protein